MDMGSEYWVMSKGRWVVGIMEEGITSLYFTFHSKDMSFWNKPLTYRNEMAVFNAILSNLGFWSKGFYSRFN
jgi:hypothetical protein